MKKQKQSSKMTNPEIESKINQLSVYEQNAQYTANQRQRFQAQLLEIDSALNEIGDSKDAFQIIGNIMVKLPAEKVKKDLKEKQERINIRVESIKKQEDTLRKKQAQLQEIVMKELESAETKENKDKK